MKKVVIIAVIILVAVGVGYYFYQHNQAKAPADETSEYGSNQSPAPVSQQPNSNPATSTPNTQTNVKGNTGADYTPSTSPMGGEIPAPDVQVVEISYDGSQFTPASVNIKANDYVFFKNNSTSTFWPASGPHPTHTDYPGFDAKKPIEAGGQYKFQFTKVGDWSFHDHLNPSAHGVVHVSK